MISIGIMNIPAEDIEYSNKDMRLRINNSQYERGELIITKREIAWKKEDSQGFSIPYEKIVVQAISSEQQRSIYFMIDSSWPGSEENTNNGSSNNGNHQDNGDIADVEEEETEEYIDCDEEPSEMTEFWLVPENSDEVNDIYYIMTRYPQNAEESEEEDENFYDDMEQMNINDEGHFGND